MSNKMIHSRTVEDQVLTYAEELNHISYPECYSEFEVQAQIYWELKVKGVDVRGCVRAFCEDEGVTRKCFLDLVVFTKTGIPVAIIEVKNSPENSLKIGDRQHRRYSKFELPLILCMNMTQVKDAVNAALTIV